MTDSKQYTPDMEKLKTELGRSPPPTLTQSRPEDFAPRPKAERLQLYHTTLPEVVTAQAIKHILREHPDWEKMTVGEREALDLIATDMARVCSGKNQWISIGEWAALGKTSEDEQLK